MPRPRSVPHWPFARLQASARASLGGPEGAAGAAREGGRPALHRPLHTAGLPMRRGCTLPGGCLAQSWCGEGWLSVAAPDSDLSPQANTWWGRGRAASRRRLRTPDDDSAGSAPPSGVLAGQAGLALTSTLVMSQSLTALLWTPLVTIWKPLAVAVCRSTGDEGREGQPGPAPRPPSTPHPRGSASATRAQN